MYRGTGEPGAGSIGRRALLGRGVAAGVAAAALVPVDDANAAGPSVGELDIRSFGAVGDGTTDDSGAFQAAFNALIANGGGELLVTNGVYKIAQPVVANCLNKASSIVIRGLGSSSQILIATGASNSTISLLNIESVLLEDLTFVGTPSVTSDALIAVNFAYCLQATVRRCDFYGVSSHVSGGAVVSANQSDLRIEDSAFRGCGGASGVGVCVVANQNWNGLTIVTTDFVDYGYLNGTYMSKTPIAAPLAWVGLFNTTQTAPRAQQAVLLSNVTMDEGAEYGVSCRPNLLPNNGRVVSLTISGLRINVAGFAVPNNGLIIQNVDHLLVERSWFGYSPLSGPPYKSRNMVSLFNVGDAVIDSCRGDNGADRIAADSQVGTLTVRETTYQHLLSQAANTQVIQGGLGARLLVADGAISANGLVVASPSNSLHVVVAPVGAPASAVLGVALDMTVNPGDSTRVVTIRGSVVAVQSDGTVAISPGDAIAPSANSAGAVASVLTGALVGRAVQAAPAHPGLVSIELLDGVLGQASPTAAQLQNGWSNSGSPFASATFTKSADGRVELRGMIQGGTTTAGTVICVLPPGYRPAATEVFPVASSGGYAEVSVATDGSVVTRQGVSSSYTSLSGIRFAAG